MYQLGEKVLCGDCLKVVDYTDKRHEGIDLCECGGEFCGCEDCIATINALISGKRMAKEVNCQNDITEWSEQRGVESQHLSTGAAATY